MLGRLKKKSSKKMDDYELSFSLNFENNSAEPILKELPNEEKFGNL